MDGTLAAIVRGAEADPNIVAAIREHVTYRGARADTYWKGEQLA